MGTESSKPRSKKSMRVATVFTGVAACTAGMAQVANAQEVAHASTARHATQKTESVTPATIKYSLGCEDANWLHASVHLYSPQGLLGEICFGGAGIYKSPPGFGLRAECGGNNHGYLGGAKGGHSVGINYTPGKGYYYLGWSHFYIASIWSWTGTDACPD